MAARKDAILGRLAVERSFLTQECLDEAFEIQRKMHDEMGMDQPLDQVLVGKHWLTPDQAHEIRNAAAIETGEARLVAGYEAISKLGQGGMGAVYRARRVGTEELVALKVLPPSLADKEMIARFKRESEIVRRLDHDNIVACVEFGFDKRRKVHFCALELVDGEDLGKRLRRVGRLSEEEAVSIASQIAMALQHAFFNGLVHRDVKPENIMVTPDGTAKLLDLGLARPASTEATRMTQSGMFVGSPYYASPEQALGEREVDARSDVYSLGATLYHMVTGKPPFEGTTALAILQQHVNEKLPWPADVNPELSDGLCRVIAKMMEKSPDDRYQTPNDLNDDLDLLMEGEEPEVNDAALRNSSIKVPAVRPGRRRPASRARAAEGRGRAGPKRAERRRRDSTREHRRGAGREARGKPSGRSSLRSGVKIGVLVVGVLVAVGVVLLFSGGEHEDRKPAGTARRRTGGAGKESSAPGTRRKAPEPKPAAPPPKTLTLDLGGGAKMEMVYIKPGVFMMGGNEDPRYPWQGVEKPKHEVAITQGFYMGKYEVTQAQYEAVMGRNPSKWKEPNRPVEQVTWHEAAEFCQLATERTRRQFRLPTEAEWEYACRAGSTGRFCFGSDETGLGGYAWYKNNSGRHTHPVGQKKPNACGLYDVHGNVLEWVADWYAADYYANSPRENPTGPDAGNRRLCRGGAWHNSGDDCRSVFRCRVKPSGRNYYHGFRAVVSAVPLQQSTSARAASTDSGEADLAPPRVRPGEKHVEPIVLLDEADTVRNWKGVKLNTEASKVRTGEASAAWVGGAVILTLPGTVPHDWTPYDAITLWVCSQVANGQRVVVTCTSPGPNGNADYFFYKRLTVDFAGWKRIELPLADFRRCRSPTGWNDITRVALHTKNFVPRLPDTRLWIDCIRLESRGAIDLTRGLVGHWKFDETTGTTAGDSSGRGNHGTVKGGAKWAKGRISGALAFDGEDDFVSIPNEAAFDITGNITVAAWIKVAAFTKEWQAIVTKGDSSWRLHRYCSGTVGRYSGTNRINFDCTGVKVRIFRGATGKVNVNDGKWHHVVGVYDGKKMWVYVDGSVSASTAASGRISVNNYEVLVGENADRTGRHWNGLIDDVRIYDRALSGGEVKALAASK